MIDSCDLTREADCRIPATEERKVESGPSLKLRAPAEQTSVSTLAFSRTIQQQGPTYLSKVLPGAHRRQLA